MSEFQLEEYPPFKVFLRLVPLVSSALDPNSGFSKSPEFHDVATQIFMVTYEMEKSLDQKVQRQYYEYQELHDLMISFIDFYTAANITDDEADVTQQRELMKAITNTRKHLNNFLKTRKLD